MAQASRLLIFFCSKGLSWLLIWNRERREPLLTKRKKESDLTQSYDKSPYTSRNVKRAGKGTTQTTPQKNFDYTAIADRLRTVSWSNYGHPSSFSMNIEKGVLIPQVIEALFIYICIISKWLLMTNKQSESLLKTHDGKRIQSQSAPKILAI